MTSWLGVVNAPCPQCVGGSITILSGPSGGFEDSTELECVDCLATFPIDRLSYQAGMLARLSMPDHDDDDDPGDGGQARPTLRIARRGEPLSDGAA